MAVQRLHKLGAILAKIAGHIRSVTDRSAFVRSSFTVRAFANEVLYSEIDLTYGTGSPFDRRAVQRLEALLRTLHANSHLAESVRHLKVFLVPVARVTDLINLCTSLRALQWLVSQQYGIRDDLLVPSPLPSVPSCIRHITVHHLLSTPFWPKTLSTCLESASGIRSLSLFTTLQTMSEIFESIGPQIQDLKVEYIVDGGSLPYGAIRTIFMPLTHLKRLRLPGYRPWQCDNVKLPHSLQRLILNAATRDDMRAICDRLSDPGWCPNMQRLPLVKRPLIPQAPFNEATRTQLREFPSACERAKAACKGRPTWLESPEDFDQWSTNFLPDCEHPEQA